MEVTLKFIFLKKRKCEMDVYKLSTPIFFEGENTFSLLEDIIKRLNKFKKYISFGKIFYVVSKINICICILHYRKVDGTTSSGWIFDHSFPAHKTL